MKECTQDLIKKFTKSFYREIILNMKPDRGGRDSAGMDVAVDSSGQQSSELDNISHSTTYAFRLLANLNELRTNSNNNLCDVEIVAGKGKNYDKK